MVGVSIPSMCIYYFFSVLFAISAYWGEKARFATDVQAGIIFRILLPYPGYVAVVLCALLILHHIIRAFAPVLGGCILKTTRGSKTVDANRRLCHSPSASFLGVFALKLPWKEQRYAILYTILRKNGFPVTVAVHGKANAIYRKPTELLTVAITAKPRCCPVTVSWLPDTVPLATVQSQYTRLLETVRMAADVVYLCSCVLRIKRVFCCWHFLHGHVEALNFYRILVMAICS